MQLRRRNGEVQCFSSELSFPIVDLKVFSGVIISVFLVAHIKVDKVYFLVMILNIMTCQKVLI